MRKFENKHLGVVVGQAFVTMEGEHRCYVRILAGPMKGWSLNVASAAVNHFDPDNTSRVVVSGPQCFYHEMDNGRLLRPVSPVYLKEGVKRLTLVDEQGKLYPHYWLGWLEPIQ